MQDGDGWVLSWFITMDLPDSSRTTPLWPARQWKLGQAMVGLVACGVLFALARWDLLVTVLVVGSVAGFSVGRAQGGLGIVGAVVGNLVAVVLLGVGFAAGLVLNTDGLPVDRWLLVLELALPLGLFVGVSLFALTLLASRLQNRSPGQRAGSADGGQGATGVPRPERRGTPQEEGGKP